MTKTYVWLRDFTRNPRWRKLRYAINALAMFFVALGVLNLYISHLEVGARWANFSTAATVAVLAYLGNRFVAFGDRPVDTAQSLWRWVTWRVLMGIPPHVFYLVLVGQHDVSPNDAKIGISVVWGIGIALWLNYLLYKRWVLPERKAATA